MRPVGNSQVNPLFNQQMINPANPQVSYQVNLQFRQSATLTVNPPFNPQMMHPWNSCSFPSANPQIPRPFNPGMIPNVNPQSMGPPGPRPPGNPQLMGPPTPRPSGNPQLMGPPAPRPSGNPQLMGPSGPRPPGHPQLMGPPGPRPQLMGPPTPMSSGNPQLMGPPGSVPSVNQQMYQGQNPSVPNSQHIPNMNQFPVPSMNCPSGMPVRPPNMPPVNLSQPVPNLNTQMMPPMNCQSYQSVNSQNIHSTMPHMQFSFSQRIQALNSANYQQNVQNVNYPNMPIINPQNVTSVKEQANNPSMNSQTYTPVGGQTNTPFLKSQTFTPSINSQNIFPSVNPQTFPSSISSQTIYSSTNPQTFPPSVSSQNIFSSTNPQTFPPSVKPQENSNAKPKAKTKVKKPQIKASKKKKTEASGENTPVVKKKKERGGRIFWEDPAYKKSENCNGINSESNTVPQTNGLHNVTEKMASEDMKLNDKKRKRRRKKAEASNPDEVAPANKAQINGNPLITIKAKDGNQLDEKKTEYFKNLRISKVNPGKNHAKKKPSENDKIKAKILKIFAIMQKLKGICKKLWQNVAANGEFKDSPAIPEEVTKFLILSHKFIGEVECIVKSTKKEESSSKEKEPKDAKTKPKDLNEASNKNSNEKSKQESERKNKNVPATLRLVLKKLDVLDALGLWFVNINGIFIKRYCSVIVKLRKSLNALLEKSKTSSKKKRLKIPRQPCLPKWGAIMLTCYGNTSYVKALQLASKNIKFKNLGIQCIKKRRSVTGGIILQVFADEDYENKTEKLAEKLKEIYARLQIRVTRPQKQGDLVITRLDPTATVEEIREQLAKLGKCSADVFKTGSRGKTCIWVRCPLSIALELNQKTIKMKSTVARINLKAKKLVRCYKCFNMGHVKHVCQSVIDHNNMCFKCGQSGHAARICQNVPRCLTCYDKSLPASHRLGGEKCPSAIPKFVKLPLNNNNKDKDSGNSNKKGNESKGNNANKKKTETVSKPPIQAQPT